MSQTIFTPSKYSLKTLEIVSFLFTGLLGVLSHFVYEWTGRNFFIGLFFPINESTWEHLKLIFFPILLVSVIECYVGHLNRSDFICIKLQSALLGMLATIVLFYTYTGVLGTVIDWVNILIFFLAIALSYIYSYRRLSNDQTSSCNSTLNLLFLFAIIILFMIFTVYPPNLGLFRVP